MAQWVKNPPAMQEMQETQVQSLGPEDNLEKEKGTTEDEMVFGWHHQLNGHEFE